MPAITGFSRSAFLPACGLKCISCRCRYSGNWPASFGLAEAGLLPSLAWQAAQVSPAIFWPLARSGFAGAWATAVPAQNMTTVKPARNIQEPPGNTDESRDFIVISASRHMPSPFAQTRFITSAVAPAGFPAEDRPEIAFAGRSNVGKSSAINALAGRKRVAFASKTPGRTQTINFFELGDRARLVDLPGYGYAAVPEA